MKQKIWIYIVLAVCVALICFGVVNLCARGQQRDASSAQIAQSAPVGLPPHYPDLDRVKTLPAVEAKEYEYEGFRVSFNRHNRTPNWVAWELLASETDGEQSRGNNFWQDERVEGCPSTYDYKNSGYDRGHMCPAADQKWSEKAMNDCFVMANMCPQDHSLNAGSWKTLENKERLWAQRDSAIVIVAGPVYSADNRSSIGGGVLVPGAFFKVLLAPYANPPRAIGFVYPNMSSPGNMQNYVLTVDEIEELTGYDFFATLPDDIENEVESKTSFNEWNRK